MKNIISKCCGEYATIYIVNSLQGFRVYQYDSILSDGLKKLLSFEIVESVKELINYIKSL